jgi:hypothetical protein
MDVFVFAAIASDEHWPTLLKGIRLALPDASILRVKHVDQAVRHLFHTGVLSAEPQVPDLILSDLDLRCRVLSDPRTALTPMIRFVRDVPACSRSEKGDPSDQLVGYQSSVDRGLELVVRDCIRRVSLSSSE